jgi:OmpR-family two-component system manganese-sensing sensor histidine kinase
MFQKTRIRLLLAYLGIFASILSVFAIAVRTVFVHTMTNQVVDKLTTLGQTIAASSGFKNGRIQVQDNLSVRDLDMQRQSLQWIDIQGNIIYVQGNRTLSLPAVVRDSIQIQPNLSLLSINIPIVDTYDRRLVGYLRVSQSLDELNETFRKLDLGLTGGAVIALLLVGLGGIFLTRQAMEPIEKSFERLQQFTADASHEMRSPLMAIRASSQVALRYPEGMRPSDAEEFNAIMRSTERMSRLTEDLLMLARLDKKLASTWENIKLAEMLKHLVDQFQAQAVAKDLTLSYQPPNDSLVIKGNSEQILRLFINLIENAIHYTPSHGKINISASLLGSWLEIEVADTGCGMTAAQLEPIFDRFWRSDTSRSQWTGGSGRGLAIAKSIAESHGGKITVTSQLEVGSCFIVKFPK